MNSIYDGPKILRKKLKLIKAANGQKLSKPQIESLIKTFWYIDSYNAIIFRTEFLTLFINFITENAFKIDKIRRSDFYEYIIEKLLTDKVADEYEKIAFQMEVLQTNIISMSTFNQLGGTTLKTDNPLLTINSEQFSFADNSIQEYLASRFINSKDTAKSFILEKIIFKDNNIRAVRPSWYSVLRFLLEKDPDLIKILLEEAVKGLTTDEVFFNILFSINPNLISPELKFQLLKQLYLEYQEVKRIWLPSWARSIVGDFVDSRGFRFVKSKFKREISQKNLDFVKIGNLVMILDSISESHKNFLKTELEYWESHLVKIINYPKDLSVAKRESLSVLTKISDARVIYKFNEDALLKAKETDPLLIESYLELLYTLASDSKHTVETLLKFVKRSNIGISFHAREGLQFIKGKQALSYLLTLLSSKENERILQDVLDHEEKLSKPLLKNISKALDKELLNKVKEFTVYAIKNTYFPEGSQLVEGLCRLIDLKSHDLYETLANAVTEPHELWKIEKLIAKIAKKKDLPLIHNIIATSPLWSEKLDKDFKLYATKKRKISPLKANKNREEFTYLEFKKLLPTNRKTYYPTVFDFFWKHHKLILDKWSKSEESKLTRLVFDDWLDKIQPQDFNYVPTGGNSYSISSNAEYFGDCIEVAAILDIKRLEYFSSKLIDYLPYSYSEHLETIFKILKTSTNFSWEYILNAYSDSNKLRYFNSTNFAKLVKELDLKLPTELRPQIYSTLYSLIKDVQIEEYERVGILDLSSKTLQTESKFEKLLIELFEDTNENQKLREKANELLIKIYSNDKAIRWRFDELLRRAQKVDIKWGIHDVTPVEDEIHTKEFASVLLDISSKYLDDYKKLLKYSIQMEEPGYRNYSGYLQSICIEFAKRLAQKKSYEGIEFIEEISKGHTDNLHIRWILLQLEEAKRVYILNNPLT